MALIKYFKRTSKHMQGHCETLSANDINKANESIAKALEVKGWGEYNTYTPGQRALLGKYAAEHGATTAAIHYSKLWDCHINESTARRLKCQYLEKIKEIAHSGPRDASVEVTALTTKEKGRPLLLGKNLDDLVKELVEILRISGGVMNTSVVMAGAQGIILSRDATKL